jgi:hypothetical protein
MDETHATDHASLQTASSVCNKWRSTVFESSRLLSKTQRPFIKKLGKRFRTVCIQNKRNERSTCSRSDLLTLPTLEVSKYLETSLDLPSEELLTHLQSPKPCEESLDTYKNWCNMVYYIHQCFYFENFSQSEERKL